MGWHIPNSNNRNPIYRAAQDLSKFAPFSDFLKFVAYHNVLGPRIHREVDGASQTIYGDIPPDELLQYYYRVLNYNEAPYETIAQTGLKNDYVYRESKRAMSALRGSETLIFPGIDIDLPTREDEAKSSPEGVKQAVTQAFQAGVHGVVLSRKYSEMRLANLSGAGVALKELGLV